MDGSPCSMFCLEGEKVAGEKKQNRYNGEKVIVKPWFPGLMLKMLLNWDLYWDK
jgi:hypothetical protein